MAHPLDIAIGARIKQVRLEQKPFVSQQWLAREVGCTVQQIAKYETGENRIAFSRLCEIAKALDISFIDLVAPVVSKTKGPGCGP